MLPGSLFLLERSLVAFKIAILYIILSQKILKKPLLFSLSIVNETTVPLILSISVLVGVQFIVNTYLATIKFHSHFPLPLSSSFPSFSSLPSPSSLSFSSLLLPFCCLPPSLSFFPLFLLLLCSLAWSSEVRRSRFQGENGEQSDSEISLIKCWPWGGPFSVYTNFSEGYCKSTTWRESILL